MNTHQEIIKIASHLMLKHNISCDWSFTFNKSYGNIGQCLYNKKEIQFSKHYLALSIEDITDIILHEIAHAIVGSKHNHDKVWKAKAIEIGCNGERLFHGVKNVSIPYKYITKCKRCGMVYGRFKSIKNISHSCSVCDSKYNPNNILVWDENV
jgi:predicted SprT family Zn-dependent metalloprotease